MPTEPPSNVLAQLRQQARLSQRELAKKLGCSHSWISKREAVPSPEIRLGELAAYIAAVGIPLQVRFLGNGLMVSPLEEPTAGGCNGAHQTLSKASPVSDKQIVSLEARIAFLHNSNTTLEATVTELRAAIAQSEVLAGNLRDQLDSSRKRNGELAATLEQNPRSHRQEVEALQRQLQAAQHELAIAHGIMHVGQKERVREALLTPEQKLERAVRATIGTAPGPPGPIVRPSCFG